MKKSEGCAVDPTQIDEVCEYYYSIIKYIPPLFLKGYHGTDGPLKVSTSAGGDVLPVTHLFVKVNSFLSYEFQRLKNNTKKGC